MNASRIMLLSLLFLLSWIMYLDRAAISTAKDLMAGELRLTDQAAGLVFGAFALGYAVAQVPAGWLADRFGPRIALTGVVVGWSVFTALTGMVDRLWMLIVVRFLFGVAEAGAFPSSARAFYSWLPSHQRGRADGIVFSGSRLGAAFSFPILAAVMGRFGWRSAFLLLGLPGVLWAIVWLLWFRDRLTQSGEERPVNTGDLSLGNVFRSRPMLLAMGQYFASNFAFFICLNWMLPYLMSHYRSKSRRIPAITGFVLATAGLVALRLTSSVEAGVACFGLATFGAEMTMSPSWAFCIDLGNGKSGSVSDAMNMVGNLGSFVSASVFPWMYNLTGDSTTYFLIAGVLNVAAGMWLAMDPPRQGVVLEKPCEV